MKRKKDKSRPHEEHIQQKNFPVAAVVVLEDGKELTQVEVFLIEGIHESS
jgi:hypothetical protein